MAYSKHTWGLNEVITSTPRLNAMEVGIEEAYLWSEAVIDGDKDMSGNSLTGLNALDASGNINFAAFKTVASDKQQYIDPSVSGDTATPSSIYLRSGVPGVVVSYVIPPAIADGSEVRFKYRFNIGGSGTVYVRQNGSNVAGPYSGSGQRVDSVDISVNRGDVIDIYITTGVDTECGAWGLRFCYYYTGFDIWTPTGEIYP